MFLGSSILQHVTGFPSFLRVNNISLCVISHFDIHLSIEEHLVSFYLLASVSNAAMNMGIDYSGWIYIVHWCVEQSLCLLSVLWLYTQK
jgi:hypothetical protein